MSLSIASLNSGSNGNCYYIGNATEAVFIDVGISCRETERRMDRLGLDIHQVKAIFVSHEHTDHISGIPVLARKYNLPVYMTERMITHSGMRLDNHIVIPFSANHPISVGELSVTGFLKFHDACDPHSFTVSNEEVTIGIFTDLGRVCDNLIHHFKQCHAAFLEANYDEEMLEQGRYPYFLKRRIRSGHGHLSNAQSLELFAKHKPPFMSHVLLSHLSKDNNCPDLVQRLFSARAGRTHVTVASRYRESEVYQVTSNGWGRSLKVMAEPVQMSLF